MKNAELWAIVVRHEREAFQNFDSHEVEIILAEHKVASKKFAFLKKCTERKALNDKKLG